MSDAAVSPARSGGRSASLVLDLFGLYVRRYDGWIAVSGLVALMADLGVGEGPTRSTLSRMVRRGLLERRPRGSVKGYGVAPGAEARMQRADRRIMGPTSPADLDDGWTVITATIPEGQRRTRDRLREQLRWLGCGSLGNAVWVVPRRSTDDMWATLRELGLADVVTAFAGDHLGAGELSDLVASAWDLDGLEEQYRSFLADCDDILASWPAAPTGADVRAFTDHTDAVHAWRKFPYLDPGLPLELLPDPWVGALATDRFAQIRRLLDVSALAYVGSVIEASSEGHASRT